MSVSDESSILMNDLISEEFGELMRTEDLCANNFEAYSRCCVQADRARGSVTRVSKQLRFMWSKLREKKPEEFKKSVYDLQTTAYYMGIEAAKLAAECKRVLEGDKE